MANQGASIDLSILSRSRIKTAMEDVRLRGGETPGPDGRSHHAVFGSGPDSRQYQETASSIGRQKHGYRFGPVRMHRIVDPLTGKERELAIPNLADRVVLRALNCLASSNVHPSPISCCRPGLDARFSVARVRMKIRELKNPIVLRLDFAKAFPSLRWVDVLASCEAQSALPQDVLSVLEQIFAFFSPNGIGVPVGVAPSPLLLELACRAFDLAVWKAGDLVYRYVDDLVVIGESPDAADEVLAAVREHTEVYGLTPNSEKSAIYADQRLHRVIRSELPVRHGPFPWLGHEITMRGTTDITENVAQRIQIAGIEKQARIRNHFILASSGPRYRTVFGGPENKNDSSAHNSGTNSENQIGNGDNASNNSLSLSAGALRKHVWQPNESVFDFFQDGHLQSPEALRASVIGFVAGDASVEGEKEAEIVPVSSSQMEAVPDLDLDDSREGGEIPEEYPNRAPDFSRPMRLDDVTATSSGDNKGRGERGQHDRFRSPRPNRRDLPDTTIGMLNRRELLRQASVWSCRQGVIGSAHAAAEAALLFNVPPPKVHQIARAAAYWEMVKQELASEGFAIRPMAEEAALQRIWPVLLCAGTLIAVYSDVYCVTDPVQVILAGLSGRSASDCKRALIAEREARAKGKRPVRLSRWGWRTQQHLSGTMPGNFVRR